MDGGVTLERAASGEEETFKLLIDYDNPGHPPQKQPSNFKLFGGRHAA